MKTIFVSIASYLDPEFSKTIYDCISKAKHPERIFIGLFLQDVKDVIEGYLLYLTNNNIRTLTCSPEEAEGCGWARNKIMQELYDNEDYFLLVDSHSRFEQDWDEKYIFALDNAPTKSVLSAFPRHYDLNETYEVYSKRDKPSIYVPNDIPFIGVFRGPHKQKLATETYEKVMNISGGNTFGPGSMVEALKLPNYNYYGHQEQELYSLLLYKCGYDIYAINQNLVWHKYFTPGIDTYRKVYLEDKAKENFWPNLKNQGCTVRTPENWVKDYKEYCQTL